MIKLILKIFAVITNTQCDIGLLEIFGFGLLKEYWIYSCAKKMVTLLKINVQYALQYLCNIYYLIYKNVFDHLIFVGHFYNIVQFLCEYTISHRNYY